MKLITILLITLILLFLITYFITTNSLRFIKNRLTDKEWLDLSYGIAGIDIPTITAKIGDMEGYFLIDSGADTNLISQYVIDTLGINASGSQKLEGMDGVESVNNVCNIDFTSNGNNYTVRCTVHEIAAVKQCAEEQNKILFGLLGNSFIAANRWVIDYHRMQMLIK